MPAYVAETGDFDFYRKVLPYADRGEATVLRPLRRALEFNLERTGRHGLPCGLSADWNDCIRLGYHGESVFVAFQVRFGLEVYAGIADQLGLPAEAAWARAERAKLEAKIQQVCWDGAWFIWAIGEDGTVYGTKDFPEGQVYMNTQVWAVISGAATPDQARTGAEPSRTTGHAIRRDALRAALHHANPEVMRATLFNAGIKENAGIFSHTQSWAVMAEVLLGDGDQAHVYYRAFMPRPTTIGPRSARWSRTSTARRPTRASMSTRASRARHGCPARRRGRYYSATHWLLGVRPEVDGLRIDPCIPRAWPGFSMRRQFRGKTVHITVANPASVNTGVKSLTVDGQPVPGSLVPAAKLRDGANIVAVLGV